VRYLPAGSDVYVVIELGASEGAYVLNITRRGG
jgi:hypothetical protein